MGRKIVGVSGITHWACVLAAVLAIGFAVPAGAAVTTVSDAFTDDASGNRDDGDDINGVGTESDPAVLWEANSGTGFMQPEGVLTNLLALQDGVQGFRAHVPIDGSSYPIGTTYTVEADVLFRTDPGDAPINSVQIGFTSASALNNTFGPGYGALSVIVKGDGSLLVRFDGQTVADETHANYTGSSDLITDGYLDLDTFNTIALEYEEARHTVRVLVNGNNLFVPRLTTGQFSPSIGKAGMTTTNTLTGGASPVPAQSVQFDNFSVSADDSTQITELEGPVLWGGHTYYLLSRSAWSTAEEAAAVYGGHLVTLETQAESDWLYSQWGEYDISGLGIGTCGGGGEDCNGCDIGGAGVIDALWIGYHQPEPVDPGDEPAGAWEWVSGSASSFTNWAPGQPGNSTVCPTAGSATNAAVMPTGAFVPENGQWMSWTTYPTVAIFGVVEVDHVSNNGFRNDWLYVRQNDKMDQWPRLPGSIKAFDEVTGEFMQLVQPEGANWNSLTFSGTGNDDARLFVCKPDGGDPSNVLLGEIDADGNVIVSTDLKTIYSNSAVTYPADHVNVNVWAIRYSAYHNSLFLALNPNTDAAADQATIHQINLDLDTVIDLYQAGSISDNLPVFLDINDHNGDLYVLHATLVSANGGLVKVDTSSGGPGTVTTLIDGSSAGGRWIDFGPQAVVYRGNNNPEHVDTLIITFKTGSDGSQFAEEYYLDQTDGSGNLLRRQEDAYSVNRGPGPGQLDEVTGTVITVRQGAASVAGNAGVDQYTAEDVNYRAEFDPAINNILYNNGYYDVDSPGFLPMGVNPVSEQNLEGFAGETLTPSSIDYVVRHKGYSGSVSYKVTESPDVSWLTLSQTTGGPIAVAGTETVTASIDTTGMAGGQYTTTLVFEDTSGSGAAFFRTVNVQLKECDWAITPQSTDPTVPGDITVYGNCAGPQDYAFTVTSLGGADLTYTVEEVDGPDAATANPTDYAWLALDKTSGGPVSAGNSDTVTVTVTSDNTIKEAWLRFTSSCDGIDPVVRKIEVTNMTETGSEKAFTHMYLGDVAPTDPDSCGVGCTFEIHTAVGSINEAIGSVVTDNDADNNKAFRINQFSGSDNTGRHGYQTYTTDETGTDIRNYVNARLGFTMLARLKCEYNQNAGALIWTWSSSRGASTGYESPKAGYNLSWGGSGPSTPGYIREYQMTEPADIALRTSAQLATTTMDQSAYHLIRVVNGYGSYGKRVMAVYYDEDPTPVLILGDDEEAGPTTANGTHDAFCFGTFGAGATADVSFDWISFTNTGMYAPGEEVDCIGSLIPEFCSDPFADVDADGDVDQDDFAVFQACFTNTGGGVPADCECLDYDGDDDIDSSDLAAFELCAIDGGPAIPADPSCDDVP